MAKRWQSSAILMVAFVSVSAASAAIPGEPTIGDINVHNFTEVIKAQQQATSAKAQFNSTITAARQRFFGSPSQAAQHKSAEIELARLLRDKDMLYLSLCVTNGVADGLVRAQGVGIITGGGGMADNGIPQPALPAFSKWANAVRASLGAKGEQQLLLPDEQAVAAAIEANAAAYAQYKRSRDKAEFGMWYAIHPGELQTPGHLPLQNQETYAINSIAIASIFPPQEAMDFRRLQIDSSQQLLVCAYGPTYSPDGAEQFTLQKFWYQKAPTDIDHLLSIDAKGTLKFLGDKGYARCPATDGDGRREMDKAALVAGAPQYATPRAAAAEKSEADAAAYAHWNSACADAAGKLRNNESGPYAALIYRNIGAEYEGVCRNNKANFGAAEVTVDPHVVCSTWNSHLDGARQPSAPNSPVGAALLASYDRHCAEGSGDLFAERPTVSSPVAPVRAAPPDTGRSGTATAPTSDAQDAHSRMCAQMRLNLAAVRAKASGLRDLLGVKSMESSINRQCGAQ